MIVTIDGPAGSGKSTAARELAGRLGLAYLDTGAMYRAVALQALQQGVELEDGEALLRVAKQAQMRLEFAGAQMRVLLDRRDVTRAVRSLRVSQATPYVARLPEVREVLVAKQRQIGRELGDVVAEGRDQGSVVFPEADVKFFLDASLETRARRRQAELMAEGEEVTHEQVLADLQERDGNDARQWAPLLVPGGAIRVDTTRMSIEQVVDLLEQAVRKRTGRPVGRQMGKSKRGG